MCKTLLDVGPGTLKLIIFSKLFDFIDELQDLACFVYKGNSKSYQPFNREWIKEKIYSLLKKQATGK